MSLLIVGSVALDSVETPKGSVHRVLGGAASYASIAASHFVKTHLVGIVGDDFPPEHLAVFENHGVDTRALEKRSGQTFFWAGRYHSDLIHRDTLITELGVFENWLPEIPENLRQSPYVFLGNIHPDLQMHVLDQMKGVRFVGCDTMNLWINIARKELDQVIRRVDLLFVNDEEARMLTGEISLSRAAKAIQNMGPKMVIIKRGEHGATLHSGEQVFFVPALPLDEVADPTGAGDTFAGALMGYVAGQNDHRFEQLCRGLTHGAVLASYCVEDFSLNQLLKVDHPQIQKRLDQLLAMIKF